MTTGSSRVASTAPHRGLGSTAGRLEQVEESAGLACKVQRLGAVCLSRRGRSRSAWVSQTGETARCRRRKRPRPLPREPDPAVGRTSGLTRRPGRRRAGGETGEREPYDELVDGDRRVAPGPPSATASAVAGCVPGARTPDTPRLDKLGGLRAVGSGADPAWPARSTVGGHAVGPPWRGGAPPSSRMAGPSDQRDGWHC